MGEDVEGREMKAEIADGVEQEESSLKDSSRIDSACECQSERQRSGGSSSSPPPPPRPSLLPSSMSEREHLPSSKCDYPICECFNSSHLEIPAASMCSK